MKTTDTETETKPSCDVLIVADSHANNLDWKVLQEATGMKVDMATAFTVDEDNDAKYKHRNFLKIAPERLMRKNYKTLILQGGCNEISNIRISQNPSPQLVKKWEEKVKQSRAKMFHLAEKSLKENPSLNKIIILKSLPRYDPLAVDPSGIKAKLNQLGNTFFTSMWMESGCPENIVIEDQHLECHGPLRSKRFGNPGDIGYDGKPWDGIHMRGRLAVRHYTNSLIRIMSFLPQTKTNSSENDFHANCPQTQYQSRQSHRGADNFRVQHRGRSSKWYRPEQNRDNNGGFRQTDSADNIEVVNRFNNLAKN
jgi:hypothetical protein